MAPRGRDHRAAFRGPFYCLIRLKNTVKSKIKRRKIERLQKKANTLLSFFDLIQQLAGSSSLSLLSYCAGMIHTQRVLSGLVSASGAKLGTWQGDLPLFLLNKFWNDENCQADSRASTEQSQPGKKTLFPHVVVTLSLTGKSVFSPWEFLWRNLVISLVTTGELLTPRQMTKHKKKVVLVSKGHLNATDLLHIFYSVLHTTHHLRCWRFSLV